ncbi:MAG: dodecin family protein [Candidatus Aminicenantes bacterium]
MSTAKVIEIIGSSETSWEDAAQKALLDAEKSVEGITGLEVVSQTAEVENNKIKYYKTAIRVAFIVK